MKIFINGTALTLDTEQVVVADALSLFRQQSSLPALFALALNGNFVGQQQYASTLLNAGDSIDIFSPIQGG